MKLLIAGKYIEIKDYVELITENPLINNFDTQYAQYSNSFSVPYNGDITDVIDVALLRKSATPYLITDAFLIDGLILIPVKILITEYDAIKNVVKLNVIERIVAGVGTGFNVRSTKMTELRHSLYLSGGIIADEYTDLILLADGGVDKTPVGDNLYVAETPVLAASQVYPHPIHSDNSCPLIDLDYLAFFLYERYGFSVTGFPYGSVFANRQKANAGDLIKCNISTQFDTDGETSQYITPTEGDITDYPAGVENVESRLNFGDAPKLTSYKNRIGDTQGRFVTCEIDVPAGEPFTPSEWSVEFKGQAMSLIEVDDRTLVFGIANLATEFSANCNTSGGAGSVISFRVSCNEAVAGATFRANVRMNISIADNNEQATDENSRQIFSNMPDMTVFDFYKAIAKASAKFLKITDTGLEFIDIAASLVPTSIFDASEYFIQASNVEYKLYDSSSLEYWYKGAETATLIVPITDDRVKSAAKKIGIDVLRTDDANVILFEDDGIKPLEGVATFPFIDITDYATDLATFYLAIEKPFIITAKFRNFDVSLEKSLLIRQLNGLFVPKRIIKTNRGIIELELLKLEE